MFASRVGLRRFKVGQARVNPRKAVEREDESMDRKLLVLAALGVSLAGCGNSSTTNNAAFNEAAAMNTPVESPPPADNAADAANAAAPADNATNAATP